MIREFLQNKQLARLHYHDKQLAEILLFVCQLSDQEQFDLLSRVVLGDDEDSKIVHGFGLVRYSHLPEPIETLAVDYDSIANIPAAGRTQLSDVALALALSAAKTGNSEELATQLLSRSKTEFDTAWLIGMLTRMVTSDSGYGLVAKEITALEQKIAEEQPKEFNRQASFPELECIVLMEAINRGMPQQDAEAALQTLLSYSRLTEKNPIASMLANAQAQHGWGNAANGRITSPLKHFVSLPFAWPIDPSPINNRSRSAVNNGWVSSAGGGHISALMLRFPLAGEFSVTANLMDDDYGESALT